MKISDIKTAEPFKAIFPINKSVLTRVIMDMQRNGYDLAHPVIIWKGKHIMVDGHTRLEAARLAGIEDIPAVERALQDEDAAVRHAIHCQRDRRNLTDADILHLVEELDKRRNRGGDRKSEKSKASPEAIDPVGKSSAQTAEIIGTSRAKVEKVRSIRDKATPEVKKAVAAGDLTINAAYKTTRPKPDDTTIKAAAAVGVPVEEVKRPEIKNKPMPALIEAALHRLETEIRIISGSGWKRCDKQKLIKRIKSVLKGIDDAMQEVGHREAKPTTDNHLEALKKAWRACSKTECAGFIQWVDKERLSDMPKGHSRAIYEMLPKLRRGLMNHPDQIGFARDKLLDILAPSTGGNQ